MRNDLRQIADKQKQYIIKETNFDIGTKKTGKVRDMYDLGDKMLIITSDRISAFDRVLTEVPFKGEILNNLSYYWFEQTKDIIDNHVIRKVGSNGILVKKCSILPIEIIVRGYLTGSGWRSYEKEGQVSGIKLPAGLKKDCKFDTPLLTPTTKPETGRDMPISVEEIIEQKIVSEEMMNTIEKTAMALFKRGQEMVDKNGLILVDTKYEFGLLEDGSLIIADEIHTSDSSRFWFKETYQECFESGKTQVSFDKEYLRNYLMNEKNYTGDGPAPVIPDNIITGVLERYIEAYEKITGETYKLENYDALSGLTAEVEQLKQEL